MKEHTQVWKNKARRTTVLFTSLALEPLYVLSVCVDVRARVRGCVSVNVWMCVYVCVCECVCVCISVHVCAGVCVLVHVYVPGSKREILSPSQFNCLQLICLSEYSPHFDWTECKIYKIYLLVCFLKAKAKFILIVIF